MEADTPYKFRIWYADVFAHLEHRTDNGNGAIIALMGAMPLYERWVKATAVPANYNGRIALVSSDLKIDDVIRTAKFWNVFRDGLCHTGSFFQESSAKNDNHWAYLPKVGLDKHYPSLPTFVTDPASGQEVIIVNPWDLISHILKKYEGNTALLDGPDAPLLPLSYVVKQTST